MHDLKVIVTGGGSGIGLTTARRMAAHGARVACLDLDPSAVEPPLIGIACDVSDDASVRPAVAAAAEQLDGIDVLVNTRGSARAGASPTTTTPSGIGCSMSMSSGWRASAGRCCPG